MADNGTNGAKNSAEVRWGDKSFRFTGNDIWTMAGAICGVSVLIILGLHHLDSKEARVELLYAIKDQTAASREVAQSTRERNCLEKFTAEERRAWAADWCKTNSR